MSESSVNKKTILVYEDDPTFRSSFVSVLETRGFCVAVANAPSSLSLDEVKEIKPDLISFDIMMAGKTGIEWAKELRKEKEFSNTPFIFVTSIADEARERDAKTVGALAYITKFRTPIIDIVGKIDSLLQ